MSLKQVILFQYTNGEQSFVQKRTIENGMRVPVERVFSSDDGVVGYRQTGILRSLGDHVQLSFPFQLEPYVLKTDQRVLAIEEFLLQDGSVQYPYILPHLLYPSVRFCLWTFFHREDVDGRFVSNFQYEPGRRK